MVMMVHTKLSNVAYMCVKCIIPLININGDVNMNNEGYFERKIDCIKSF